MSDLMELLRRDPFGCSRADIGEIVKAYRDRRAQFQLGNMTAGKVKAPTAKESEALKVTKGLDIKDLL